MQDLDFSESYAWPTWSPDGTRLAVSRVQITPNRSLEVSVQVIDVVTGANRTVYENDVPALVADGTPHYLYWSPNSEYLSFLATTRQGMTLFAVNPQTTEGAIALERGAPLYFSWGGNGDSLLVHSRDEVKLLQRPFEPSRALLLANAAGFRTPALSLDGRKWATRVEMLQTAISAWAKATIRPCPGAYWTPGPWWHLCGRPMAAPWPSPITRIPRVVFSSAFRLVDADGSNLRTLAEEPLIAFYWAPNSERLAWVGVDAKSRCSS